VSCLRVFRTTWSIQQAQFCLMPYLIPSAGYLLAWLPFIHAALVGFSCTVTERRVVLGTSWGIAQSVVCLRRRLVFFSVDRPLGRLQLNQTALVEPPCTVTAAMHLGILCCAQPGASVQVWMAIGRILPSANHLPPRLPITHSALSNGFCTV
jgi:hypothetical protein